MFFGLALITIGLLFLLREIGVIPDVSLWTMLWLGVGGWLFIGTLAGNRRGWFWPLTLLAVGLAMLLRDLEILSPDFALWPVWVIAMGVAITLEATQHRDDEPKDPWQRTIDV